MIYFNFILIFMFLLFHISFLSLTFFYFCLPNLEFIRFYNFYLSFSFYLYSMDFSIFHSFYETYSMYYIHYLHFIITFYINLYCYKNFIHYSIVNFLQFLIKSKLFTTFLILDLIIFLIQI